MTDGLPRRVRPSGHEGVVNQLRAQQGMASGRSKSLRPVPARAATHQQADSIDPGDRPRLGLLYRLDTSGLAASAKVYVPSWTTVEEDAGGSVLVAGPFGIGIFAPGIYSVHLYVHGEGMQNADPACSVLGFCDYFDPFTESFACATRGGDPSSGLLFPSTSRTYYHPGGDDDALQPGLAWNNLDPAVVSELLVEVQVQQIA